MDQNIGTDGKNRGTFLSIRLFLSFSSIHFDYRQWGQCFRGENKWPKRGWRQCSKWDEVRHIQYWRRAANRNRSINLNLIMDRSGCCQSSHICLGKNGHKTKMAKLIPIEAIIIRSNSLRNRISRSDSPINSNESYARFFSSKWDSTVWPIWLSMLV